MGKLLLIDGNNIMNRAFYGIMNSKLLQTKDGKYTNAIYGFLSILFKVTEELKPDYLAVTFDLKTPTFRHNLYKEYKAGRQPAPQELIDQMPEIKKVLECMNIPVLEMEGYEADDLMGTYAKMGEKEGLEVVILSGDRDTFQLISDDNIIVKIPRTKMGKTEVEDFNEKKIKDVYGIKPIQFIEIKGLQGDSTDNIPGVPGVGEKTALKIIQEYESIDKLYKEIENGKAENIKGKTREKIIENRELAELSKKLGTIDINVPVEKSIDDLKIKEWDRNKVLQKFEELSFNRFIEKFNLYENGSTALGNTEVKSLSQSISDLYKIEKIDFGSELELLKSKIRDEKKIIYYLSSKQNNESFNTIKEEIDSISIWINDKVYYLKITEIDKFAKYFKDIFEDSSIKKYGYELKKNYVLLHDIGIEMKELDFDIEIAAYLLNPTQSKFEINYLADTYLDINMTRVLSNSGIETKQTNKQINLFDKLQAEDDSNEDMLEEYRNTFSVYIIYKLLEILQKKLDEINGTKLFNEIEMPTSKVLAKLQCNGMNCNKDELISFGSTMKVELEKLTKEIYDLAGQEFNINSTKQLGKVLFEDLKLPAQKKTKSGYSTDVETLESLVSIHPIVDKILEYRGLMKLNSTYVEGLIPYINEKTGKIHSTFNQTITATGRISSSDPNLQNIPTRYELGKQLRKVFKASDGYIFIDADYSQIELRVLAHISQDKVMLEAFKNSIDIHKQAASMVLNKPVDEVTKEERSRAKAVNFGIIYGISAFGLSKQIGTTRKVADEYIKSYLEKYSGIDEYMKSVVNKAKENGYAETLYGRRRYIPELQSRNFSVREFGKRAAMNTPIQGTAADIMKIAMVKLNKELEYMNSDEYVAKGNKKLDAKLVLQVHDELILEVKEEQKEEAKELLKRCMESAVELSLPLEVDVEEGKTWYDIH